LKSNDVAMPLRVSTLCKTRDHRMLRKMSSVRVITVYKNRSNLWREHHLHLCEIVSEN